MNAMRASLTSRGKRPHARRHAGRRRGLGLVLLLAAAGCNCSGDEGGDATTPPAGAGAPGAATSSAGKREAKTLDPASVGNVSGRITVKGTAPAPKPLVIVGDSFCVQAHPEPVLDDRLVVQGDRLQNAFVWVKSGLDDYRFDGEGRPDLLLEQKGCLYSPKVMGVQLGQKISASSFDPVLHNVHTHPKINKPQNFAMPQGSPPIEFKFRKAEVMVPVACDVHAWMKSYIGVLDHPYFAVTGADGSFRIEGLPPGSYTLGVWHEQLGEQELPFTLEAKGQLALPPVVYAL